MYLFAFFWQNGRALPKRCDVRNLTWPMYSIFNINIKFKGFFLIICIWYMFNSIFLSTNIHLFSEEVTTTANPTDWFFVHVYTNIFFRSKETFRIRTLVSSSMFHANPESLLSSDWEHAFWMHICVRVQIEKREIEYEK